MTPRGRRTGRPGLEHRGQREQTAPAGPADSSPNRRQWRQMGSGWRSGMVRAVGDGELVAALSELRIRKTPRACLLCVSCFVRERRGMTTATTPRHQVLTDKQWERIEPMLPSNTGRKGRPFHDNRKI